MDITSNDTPDGQWMTYRALAEARGTKLDAAIRMTQRKGWRRQPGNDGRMLVLVPPEATKPSERNDADDVLDDVAGNVTELLRETLETLKQSHGETTAALKGQISTLRGELTAMRVRCAACEQELTESRAAAAELRAAIERESARGLAARIMNAVRGVTLLRILQAPLPALSPAASSDLPKGVGADEAPKP